MQTFLPYKSFKKSAEALDNRRLGKQRVEVLQLLRALNGETKGWVNHPAAKMWRGYEQTLIIYGTAICLEWRKRGFKDTCLEKIQGYSIIKWGTDLPWWLGDEQFHASHRSNLLRKDPVWYGQFGWSEAHDLPYIWPVGG